MHFSEESRFFMDNIKLIQDTFHMNKYSYIYFFRFLLHFRIISGSKFNELLNKVGGQDCLMEEIYIITEDCIPNLLFKIDDFKTRRRILLAIAYYCITIFGYSKGDYENTLHLW